MNLSKEAIIELSDKFPFRPFSIEATATDQGHGGTNGAGEFASCGNHLDHDFIKLLDQGAHLDLGRMPL